MSFLWVVKRKNPFPPFVLFIQNRKRKNGNGSTHSQVPSIVDQLLSDPAELERMRQADLLASAAQAHNVASEAYIRSICNGVDAYQSRSESLPFVFDAMGDLLASRPAIQRSKVRSCFHLLPFSI